MLLITYLKVNNGRISLESSICEDGPFQNVNNYYDDPDHVVFENILIAPGIPHLSDMRIIFLDSIITLLSKFRFKIIQGIPSKRNPKSK